MSRSVFLLVVTTLLVLVVNGTVFRLGTVIHMTSNDGSQISSDGSQRLSGFLLAVNDFNQQYGHPNNITVKFAVRDGHASFMSTAVATASLLTTAFPKSGGIQAIIGGGANTQAQAIADTSAEFKLPQLTFGADSSDFSHGSQYPYVARFNHVVLVVYFTIHYLFTRDSHD